MLRSYDYCTEPSVFDTGFTLAPLSTAGEKKSLPACYLIQYSGYLFYPLFTLWHIDEKADDIGTA